MVAAMDTTLPLSNIKVLDLTLARAGPTCVRHLADWGADVIRIEPPAKSAGADELTGYRNGPDYQNLHRNKRMVQLDLKAPEGHAAFMRLAKDADVIVENMRVDVKHRLKVAWEDVHPLNSRLVYGSISGFGQTGPYASRGGVDQIAQGMGGLMSITGLPGQGPVRAGVAISDVSAGNLLAFGIMMALFERERTGVGRWVHTSLLEAQVHMLDFQAARWLMDHEVAGQAGNDHPTGIPMGTFPTADGYINLAASGGRLWKSMCEAMGKPEWAEKPEWKSGGGRSKDRAALNAAISEVTKRKPSAYWMEALEAVGVPCGPIYSIDQVFADPQVRHLGIAAPTTHPSRGATELINSPLNLSDVPKGIRYAAPPGGEHTDEVLHSVGYSDDEIASMRAKGVI
jgi:crotonobetainyl-CoA:carnitine CoA-transferase CaiB-like acyl-CoA transferase